MKEFELHWHYNLNHPNIARRDKVFKTDTVKAANPTLAREKSAEKLNISEATPIYLKEIIQN